VTLQWYTSQVLEIMSSYTQRSERKHGREPVLLFGVVRPMFEMPQHIEALPAGSTARYPPPIILLPPAVILRSGRMAVVVCSKGTRLR